MKICPVCGESDEAIGFHSNLCANCYAERNRLFELKKDFEVQLCSSCGKAYIGGWHDFSEAELKKWLETRIGSEFKKKITALKMRKEGRNFAVEIGIEFEIGGSRVAKEARAVIKPKYTMCVECLKKNSQRIEAVIQVRRNVDRVVERICRALEKAEVGYSVKELKEGADIETNDSAETSRILREMKYKLFVTSSLVGQTRDGKPKHKKTFRIDN